MERWAAAFPAGAASAVPGVAIWDTSAAIWGTCRLHAADDGRARPPGDGPAAHGIPFEPLWHGTARPYVHPPGGWSPVWDANAPIRVQPHALWIASAAASTTRRPP